QRPASPVAPQPAQLSGKSAAASRRKCIFMREVDSPNGRFDTAASPHSAGQREHPMSSFFPEMLLAGIRVGAVPRNDWTLEEAAAVFAAPFNDLVFAAQWVHRQHFAANMVQISTLLSIKTGACPEDCAYC